MSHNFFARLGQESEERSGANPRLVVIGDEADGQTPEFRGMLLGVYDDPMYGRHILAVIDDAGVVVMVASSAAIERRVRPSDAMHAVEFVYLGKEKTRSNREAKAVSVRFGDVAFDSVETFAQSLGLEQWENPCLLREEFPDIDFGDDFRAA